MKNKQHQRRGGGTWHRASPGRYYEFDHGEFQAVPFEDVLAELDKKQMESTKTQFCGSTEYKKVLRI